MLEDGGTKRGYPRSGWDVVGVLTTIKMRLGVAGSRASIAPASKMVVDVTKYVAHQLPYRKHKGEGNRSYNTYYLVLQSHSAITTIHWPPNN